MANPPYCATSSWCMRPPIEPCKFVCCAQLSAYQVVDFFDEPNHMLARSLQSCIWKVQEICKCLLWTLISALAYNYFIYFIIIINNILNQTVLGRIDFWSRGLKMADCSTKQEQMIERSVCIFKTRGERRSTLRGPYNLTMETRFADFDTVRVSGSNYALYIG